MVGLLMPPKSAGSKDASRKTAAIQIEKDLARMAAVIASNPVAEMPRVYRPKFRDRKTGKWIRSPNWYCEWRDSAGKKQRKSIGPSKNEALEYLGKVREPELRAAGRFDILAAAKAKQIPLATWVSDYLDVLAARETSGTYRANVRECLTRLLIECGWNLWRDITGDSLLLYCGRYRRDSGVSSTTANNTIRTARGFTRWLAERVQERDPLARVPFYPETERRRSKRILTDAELERVIAAAEKSRRQVGDMTGRQRAMLYRVAAYTGLRAGELAKLRREHFHLDAKPPHVRPDAKDTKAGRDEPIPLPSHLVPTLRTYLARARGVLWPGNFRRILAADMRAAKVDAEDERGRRATFHGLRRGYVVRIIRAGAKIHEVRRLARHVDVATTLEYYTDETLQELGELVNRT